MIIEARAGDIVFFHYFTIYGSMTNRSNTVRKTVIVQMHAGDDCVESDVNHRNEKMAFRGWNFHATRQTAQRKLGMDVHTARAAIRLSPNFEDWRD